jgi:ABC-2 type transport system permease protein
MQQRYSQGRALWSITKASFKSILATPTAIFFSLVFPIIFILIFGAFGNEGPIRYKIALSGDSDTSNVFYSALKKSHMVSIANYKDTASQKSDLYKGKITAILSIQKTKDSSGKEQYLVSTRSTTASSNTFQGFVQVLDYLQLKIQAQVSGNKNDWIKIVHAEPEKIRSYKQIDFILPGMLGFSVLFSTLFGMAFLFYTLREQLVLKRFYASPVSRINILLGVGTSRLFFQLMNVVILVLFGHFFLQFTLIHGILTFVEIVLMTIIMLFLLLGVGLIFSSISKTDANIPLLVNLFGFPQMMLAGTFFPIEVFPKWLQEICHILPLTQYNDAIRKISFEGLHITDCLKQLGILGIWIAVIYVIAVRVIKWE